MWGVGGGGHQGSWVRGAALGLQGQLGPLTSLTGPVLSCPEALTVPSSGQLSTRRVGVGVGRKQDACGPCTLHTLGCCHLDPPGPGPGPGGQQACFLQSAKSRAAASQTPISADSGLPNSPQRLGRKEVQAIQLYDKIRPDSSAA